MSWIQGAAVATGTLALAVGPAFAQTASISNGTGLNVTLVFDGQSYEVPATSGVNIDTTPKAVPVKVTLPDGRTYSQTLDFTAVEAIEDLWVGGHVWCVGIWADKMWIEKADDCDLYTNG